MSEFDAAFPSSRKVYVDGGAPGREVRVPMREIALSNGDHLRVYDTSGPEGGDVRHGLPPLRAPWIAARDVAPVEPTCRASAPGAPEIPQTLGRTPLRGTRPVTGILFT